MKYLKSLKENIQSNAQEIIESILDNHLDEFPNDFTYIIIPLKETDHMLKISPCIAIMIDYLISDNSSLVKLLTQMKKNSNKELESYFMAEINDVEVFKRINKLTGYKIDKYVNSFSLTSYPVGDQPRGFIGFNLKYMGR